MVKLSFSTLFTHLMFWSAMAVASYNAFIDKYDCATFFLVLALFIEFTNLMEIIKRSLAERNTTLQTLADIATSLNDKDN